MAKPGNESAELILGFRREKSNGRIGKRFRDEFYALDLIRVLYDDTVSPQVKLEVLIVLEEYAHIGITEESVDQVVSSLLDIYHQAVDRGARGQVMCQILSTCTSLLIQLDQLDTELSGSFVKELVHVVMSRVNQPGSERLRACACQSLMHIETFSPGMLSCHYEELAPLYQREKTYVFQDYSLLVAKILESLCSVQPKSPKSPTDKLYVQKQVSSDSAELRKTVSDLVENVAMLTRSGSFQITQSLASIVSQQPDIPAVIARPMMLHQVASMSCIVFHTVLYLQRVFNGEALTGSEEAELLHRLCNMTRHPCLNELHRLLAVHWVHGYKQRDIGKVELPEMVVRHHRLMFYPSVFDSVDCQLARLYITSLCSDTSSDTEGMETSILLGSLGCLHKLVWHTGSSQAARSLFRALYFIYTRHHNQHFSRDIQRFVRGLISEFAHFIPHSIDFVDSIHSLEVNSGMFVETLSLLHQQVVMATEEQMHESYTFYLQIMKKVSTQTQINQNCTLKFLYYLAQHAAEIDDSSWLLGHGILGICRNIIIHHGTQQYFPGREVFLDSDQVSSSLSTMAFIMSSALILPALTLIGKTLNKLCKNQITVFLHYYAYYTWILIACLLACILDILNLFDNIMQKDNQTKSGHSCYYIYVFEGTMNMTIGIGLCWVACDILMCISGGGKMYTYMRENSIRIHFVCFLIMCTSFMLNNIPDITGIITHTHIHSCWKGNVYGHNISFIGKLDLSLQLLLLISMLILCVAIMMQVRIKFRENETILTPEFMLGIFADEEEEAVGPSLDLGYNLNSGDFQEQVWDCQDPQSDSTNSNSDEVKPANDAEAQGETKLRRKHSRPRRKWLHTGSHRQRSEKISRDNMSSESSCHENSGYMSDSGHESKSLDPSTAAVDARLEDLKLEELSGLLFDLLTAYNHIDVQDRAKFYYCLITSASDTKVRQVLQTSASDVESLNQALTSILPGVSEKKSLANIVQLDHGDMLNWERVGVEVSCREREDKKTSCDQDQQDAIEKYENVLSTLELNVDLKCRLRLTDTGQFDILHAVSVTLEDCLHFEHIPKKHLPCIYKTGSREVVFQLKPRQPLPQVFPASVDFCDESKQTFSASLTPVAVKFCEMMIPLPWKPDNNNLMPEFFQGLWNRALKLTENGESSGIESVKQFEISSQQYCDASRKHLEPFLLGHKIDFSSSCYGILLPPGYHVLLRCKGQGQARSTLTVAMVMDRKSLLPHVDKFLKTIFASH